MNVFDAFQIPFSAVQRDHEELIAQAADKGAGTLIRGGAARGAASEDKNWRTSPLTQAPGLGQRNWEASGMGDLLAGAGMSTMEFVLRFTLSHPAFRPPSSAPRTRRTWPPTSPPPRRAPSPPTSTKRRRSAFRSKKPTGPLFRSVICRPAVRE